MLPATRLDGETLTPVTDCPKEIELVVSADPFPGCTVTSFDCVAPLGAGLVPLAVILRMPPLATAVRQRQRGDMITGAQGDVCHGVPSGRAARRCVCDRVASRPAIKLNCFGAGGNTSG